MKPLTEKAWQCGMDSTGESGSHRRADFESAGSHGTPRLTEEGTLEEWQSLTELLLVLGDGQNIFHL